MIKKTQLAWGTRRNIESDPIKGYYDTAERWFDIEIIYLSHTMAKKMIKNMATVDGKPTHIRWDGKKLVLGTDNTQTIVNPEEIVIDDDNLVVYKLPTKLLTPEKAWFDWTLDHDGVWFCRSDIYEAVFEGLEIGVRTGAAGQDKIDGLSLREYANKYASEADKRTPF